MSEQPKNNLPLIAGIVAILAIGGGAMFYFSKNMTNEEAAPVASSTDTSTEPSTGASAPIPASAEEEAEATAAAGSIEGVEVRPGNPIVAKVDGQPITRVDVFRYIKLMPANIQQLPPAAVYPLALDQVINTRLVQNKAEAAGLESDPEVQEQLSLAKQQIVRSVYVQREVDKQISDGDIKNAYNEYVEKIPAVEEVKAAHILVGDEAKAKDLIEQLKGGADFAKLAAANSGDPGNKDKGGELGWFAKQDMVPEFSEAAFKIEKGQIGDVPVKTQFGWHVIKVEDKRQRPKPTLEEMTPMIQVELRRQKLEGMLKDWRETAAIETFDVNGDPVKAAEAPVAAPAEAAPAAGGESAPAEAPAAETPAQ